MTLKVTAARASRADEDRQNHRGRAQIRSRTRTNRRRSNRIRNAGEKEGIPGEGLRDLREDVNCSRLVLSRRSVVEAAVSAARSDARPQTNNLSHRAGCNGAGKTTFAKEFLPYEVKCLRFYNADEIVRGLSPLDPSAGAIKAGRLLLGEVRDSINRHETFALKHAQRQDVYSYLRARAFIRLRSGTPLSLAFERGAGDRACAPTRYYGRTRCSSGGHSSAIQTQPQSFAG